MKKHSKHARRMAYRRKKNVVPGLNLVSLMDIFTILVFFLLVNSSNNQQLPSKDVIDLPKSIASQLPKETLVIMVNASEILVQGRKIADISGILASTESNIPGLAAELKFQARKSAAPVNPEGKAEREVTIMGDKKIPYEILKKIMLTCSSNEYSRISLAVAKKTSEESPS